MFLDRKVIGEPTTKRGKERAERLLPNGVPKKIRVYDNGGETADRYTVVFTGRWTGKRNGECAVRTMGDTPRSPIGFCMFDIYPQMIDYPTYGHLGKKIKFEALPKACREIVVQDYRDLWKLPGGIDY